jgi:hypothetical protein
VGDAPWALIPTNDNDLSRGLRPSSGNATLQSQSATDPRQPGAQSVSVTLFDSSIVTSSPPGMICSSGTCVQDFVAGYAVKLLAKGVPGWTFIGWSGSCTGTEICVLAAGGRDFRSLYRLVLHHARR